MKYILKLENLEVWLSKNQKTHELTTINNCVYDHPDFLFAYMCVNTFYKNVILYMLFYNPLLSLCNRSFFETSFWTAVYFPLYVCTKIYWIFLLEIKVATNFFLI